MFRLHGRFHYRKNPPQSPHCHNCSLTRWSRWKKGHSCHCLWLVSPSHSVSLHSKHTDTKVSCDHCTHKCYFSLKLYFSFSLSVSNRSFKLQDIGLFLFSFQHKRTKVLELFVCCFLKSSKVFSMSFSIKVTQMRRRHSPPLHRHTTGSGSG